MTRNPHDNRDAQVIDGVGTHAQQTRAACAKPGKSACLFQQSPRT
jgi:hypothetical protein